MKKLIVEIYEDKKEENSDKYVGYIHKTNTLRMVANPNMGVLNIFLDNAMLEIPFFKLKKLHYDED